jgi:hypothetical protein
MDPPKTKIIASLGVYDNFERTISDLFEAGANGFRIDDRYLKLTNEMQFSEVMNSIQNVSK